MEYLARFSATRPIAICVVAVMVVIFGVMSWQDLDLDLFPDVQSPTVMVTVSSGNRPATEMETLYGERIERQLFTVRGLKSIEQVARTGKLVTRITFNWDADVDLALIDVNRAISPISADIDVDEVNVKRFDPNQLPIVVLGLVSNDDLYELSELKRLTKRQLAPAIEQLEGVAEARISGGRVKQVKVQIDPVRLSAHGITIEEVSRRIKETNIDINAGTFVEGDRVLLVRGGSRFVSPQDIEQVVIEYVEDEFGTTFPLRVSDVADVGVFDADINGLVRVNGKEGIGIFVYKEGGANTVSVSNVVKQSN